MNALVYGYAFSRRILRVNKLFVMRSLFASIVDIVFGIDGFYAVICRYYIIVIYYVMINCADTIMFCF